MKNSRMTHEGGGHIVPAFNPDPSKSANYTIAASGTEILDTTEIIMIRFCSEGGEKLKIKYNSNTAYWMASAGGIVVGRDISQISFENPSASIIKLCVECR